MTDQLPSSFRRFASRSQCEGCGDVVDEDYLIDRKCPGCRYGGQSRGQPVTDGGYGVTD